MRKNKQGIFDQQNELCEFFSVLNSNLKRFINYKVTNDGIFITVMYDKYSDWNAIDGKRILQKLVDKYKLHLIGYEKSKIFFSRTVNTWSKYKLSCEYTIPLSLLKFDLNTFYYSKDYLDYKKDQYNKFELFWNGAVVGVFESARSLCWSQS